MKTRVYQPVKTERSKIGSVEIRPGESLMHRLQRAMSNKEPIGDAGLTKIYTERAEGVLPHTNIRNDKFEAMIEAADAKVQFHKERRAAAATKAIEEKNPPKKGKAGEKGQETGGASGESTAGGEG